MPRIAQAGQDRSAEALGGQQSASARARLPPQQRRNDAEIGRGVDPERRNDAIDGNGQAAERRPDGARDIDADRIGRDRRWQVVLGHKIGYDRLPGRHRHRAGGADQKCEYEEVDRRRPTEPNDDSVNGGDDGRDGLDHDQKFALVENVGQRAGWNCEQADRQARRRLDQRDHDRD